MPFCSRFHNFDPEKEIRINAEHILQDDENVKRLPSPIRAAWNLPLLLETAVEMSRRKALVDWNLAVPQVFQNRIQYLLPIHLTNMAIPDLAIVLSGMDGYYIGHTCLTRQMAYQNARLLARPTAGWLIDLVELSAPIDRTGKEPRCPESSFALNAEESCFYLQVEGT